MVATMISLFLLACAPIDTESTDAAADDTAGSSTDTGDSEPLAEPAALVEPSAGSCPDFGEGGKVKFTSNGQERVAYVDFPEDRSGDPLPVVFVWLPLGASASQMRNWVNAEDWAKENRVITITPDSLDSELLEWQFMSSGEDDLAMFDDLRACAITELNGDIRRVSAMGMSAGALWTTFLGIHRGDSLATIMPWSGGTGDIVNYSTPAHNFPALLVYGGESDTYNAGALVVHFDQLTAEFAAQLHADDHYVAMCNHEGGHDFPPNYMDFMTDWLLVHEYGVASPFSGDGDPADLEDFCGDYAPPVED